MIQNVDQDHIAVIHLGNSKIVEGHHKIVHEINVTKISQTIQDVKIQILARQDENDETASIIKRKISDLETNLQQIQPTHRRTKRWDALG